MPFRQSTSDERVLRCSPVHPEGPGAEPFAILAMSRLTRSGSMMMIWLEGSGGAGRGVEREGKRLLRAVMVLLSIGASEEGESDLTARARCPS